LANIFSIKSSPPAYFAPALITESLLAEELKTAIETDFPLPFGRVQDVFIT